jgi:hypothetical protein
VIFRFPRTSQIILHIQFFQDILLLSSSLLLPKTWGAGFKQGRVGLTNRELQRGSHPLALKACSEHSV